VKGAALPKPAHALLRDRLVETANTSSLSFDPFADSSGALSGSFGPPGYPYKRIARSLLTQFRDCV
jgi:hypothetical protein